MRIEVCNTGTELLLGKVVNTHAAYFGQELFKLGLRVQKQTTIPDGDDIRTVLEDSFSTSDVILVTGGLGPTSDDITREVVAAMLERELRLDQEIRDQLHEFFRKRGLKADRSNDRQAMVPEGAEVLENPHGTAPGLYLPAVDHPRSPHLFLLPGPPRELRPMFQESVFPRIEALLPESKSNVIWKNFRVQGIGESMIAGRLDPIFGTEPKLEIGYCARLGEVDVRLIGDEESVDSAAAQVREMYHEDIVAESEDPLEEVVVALLADRSETVATAESCTGGQIASTLTDVAGSSRVFERGFVTYANEAKAELVGVDPHLIRDRGAVSFEVVEAMANGCLEVSGADHAIAVSGIAGPGGGSAKKPVGTVYLALASRNSQTFVKRHFIPTDRKSFKLRVTRLALDMLRRRLRGFALD